MERREYILSRQSHERGFEMNEIIVNGLYSLSELIGKHIKIVTNSGNHLEGIVTSYEDEYDSEYGAEVIHLEYGEALIALKKSEIRSLVEIIKLPQTIHARYQAVPGA